MIFVGLSDYFKLIADKIKRVILMSFLNVPADAPEEGIGLC
jgi:hypothetical protein